MNQHELFTVNKPEPEPPPKPLPKSLINALAKIKPGLSKGELRKATDRAIKLYRKHYPLE